MPHYITMHPACPLPQHITALYMIAVISSIALFSQSITIVSADILVYCGDDQVDYFRDLPSRFGDSLPSEGLEGYVVYSDPPLACVSVKPPPVLAPNYTKPWVLLISRGNCSYETKVRNAQAANFNAVIVHNVNSSDLEPMSAANPTGIYIPSVFVGERSGAALRKEYQFNETRYCYIVINDDMPFNINTHLLLPFATVVGICCLIMLLFTILKCLQDQRRQRRHRLPPASLRQIPTSKFQKGDPYETCAICLEDYQEGEKLRILPCSHAYHSKCIDPWLTRNRRVCPVCKRKVFAQDERVSDSDSDSDVDDTTPLVRPGSQGTQGGTFVRSTGNPISNTNTSSPWGSSYSSIASSSASFASTSGGRQQSGRGGTATAPNDNEAEATKDNLEWVNSRARQGARRFLAAISALNNSTTLPEQGDSSSGSTNRLQGDGQGTVSCYNMSSGEHSINSQPTDLDFSDDHFERQGASSQWGSRAALLGSRSEAEGCEMETGEATEAVEQSLGDTSLPSVSVRSSGSRGSNSSEHKPAVV